MGAAEIAPLPMNASSPPRFNRSALLLGALLLGQAALAAFLVFQGRVPRGHDTFQYFALQYYFLSGAAYGGEIPQWIPYMTHGVVANWLCPLQISFLQGLFLGIARVLKGMDFLPLFHLGMLFDECVLMLGVWLLGRRLFVSRLPVFVAALTAVGSNIWMSQVWWNSHFGYALPLVLWLGHRYLDTGRWAWAALAGNLLALQMLGNLPYCVPVQGMVVAVYFGAWLVLVERRPAKEWPPVRCPRGFFLALGVAAVSFALVGFVLRSGTESLVNYNWSRGEDGKVPLLTFLTYGSHTGWGGWLELLARSSAAMNTTLYVGVIGIWLALVGGVSGPARRARPVWAVVVVLVLFTSGGMVSWWFFRVWPGMDLYRHVALAASVVRLFLCFAAGFGVEALMAERPRRAGGQVLLAGGMGVLGLLLLLGSRDAAFGAWLANALVSHAKMAKVAWMEALRPEALSRNLALAGSLGLLACVLGILLARNTRHRRWVVFTVVALQALDLAFYKGEQAMLRTYVASPDERVGHVLTPLPFEAKRGLDDSGNARRRALSHEAMQGATYWTLQAYTFADCLGSPYRVDYWLGPVDDLLRAMEGPGEAGKTRKPGGLRAFRGLRWPTGHPGTPALTGMEPGKLQVFQHPYRTGSREEARALVADRSFDGQGLVLGGEGKKFADDGASITRALMNGRIPARMEITSFSANRLELDVEAAGAPGTNPWLLYCDAWHPWWKAEVNGRAVPVEKGNLAYKAIPLDHGRSHVVFRFGSSVMRAVYFVLMSLLTAWIVLVVVLLARASRDEVPVPSAGEAPVGATGRRIAVAGGVLLAITLVAGVVDLRNGQLLIAGAASGWQTVVSAALAFHPDPDRADGGGNTPLMAACLAAHPGIVRGLLDRGAKPDLVNGEGSRALHLAASSEKPSGVGWLLAHGASPDARDGDGYTALHLATWRGNSLAVDLLLAAGADPNLSTRSGKTALMFAAWQGDATVARSLLGRGAAVGTRDEEGWTALRCARAAGHSEVAQMLQSAGARE